MCLGLIMGFDISGVEPSDSAPKVLVYRHHHHIIVIIFLFL